MVFMTNSYINDFFCKKLKNNKKYFKKKINIIIKLYFFIIFYKYINVWIKLK